MNQENAQTPEEKKAATEPQIKTRGDDSGASDTTTGSKSDKSIPAS